MKKKTLLSWSSGKDSAWTLHCLKQNPDIQIIGLFTSANQKYNRASMHATRLEMLEKQAHAAGYPLRIIHLPEPCTDNQYAIIMKQFITASVDQGIECMAFGDLFLAGIRQYREDQLKGTGIEPIFPLWGIPTDELAKQMLSSGIQAYISCVDLKKLSSGFAGRKWSRSLIAEFPPGIDPCGENGEFHTIVTGGPMFIKTFRITVGEIIRRNGFAYADIVPLKESVD